MVHDVRVREEKNRMKSSFIIFNFLENGMIYQYINARGISVRTTWYSLRCTYIVMLMLNKECFDLIITGYRFTGLPGLACVSVVVLWVI